MRFGCDPERRILRNDQKSRFKNITVQKEKSIFLPDDILKKYLDEKSLPEFRKGNTGIFSVTVYGEKGGSMLCAGMLQLMLE
jgi:hypothetical protein